MDEVDLLELYDRGSGWTLSRVRGAVSSLDVETGCDGWDVRTLLNHMLDTQRFFTGTARGEDVPLPAPTPPLLLDEADPVGTFERSRSEFVRAFSAPGVVDKSGPALGIAFADQLLHGWDLAMATGQDPTMPEGLPDAAYRMIHGRFTDEQRVGVFKPEIDVPPDAGPQEKFLAYTGRDPSR
jgi:uncharacterized protein (TIGR03086 family)